MLVYFDGCPPGRRFAQFLKLKGLTTVNLRKPGETGRTVSVAAKVEQTARTGTSVIQLDRDLPA